MLERAAKISVSLVHDPTFLVQGQYLDPVASVAMWRAQETELRRGKYKYEVDMAKVQLTAAKIGRSMMMPAKCQQRTVDHCWVIMMILRKSGFGIGA